jgi:hypothetical protein
MRVGVSLDDSSATDSRSANCFNLLPDVGTSVGRERYGEMSAMLELRREELVCFRAGVEDDGEEAVEIDGVESVADGGSGETWYDREVASALPDGTRCRCSGCFVALRESWVGSRFTLATLGDLSSEVSV